MACLKKYISHFQDFIAYPTLNRQSAKMIILAVFTVISSDNLTTSLGASTLNFDSSFVDSYGT